VLCVFTSLGDHKRKYRESQAAYDAKGGYLWEEQNTEVIKEHRYGGNYFQSIATENAEFAHVYAHCYPSLVFIKTIIQQRADFCNNKK
jgi:hypothetical protein